MPRKPTRTEDRIDRSIESHTGDPVRTLVLKKARLFKSSWVDLAQVLSRVRNKTLFEDWGFDSFSQYCLKELHIRRATADKLTASYGYLKDRASEVLDRDGITRPIPSFQSVSYLARAEEEGNAEEETLQDLREEVFERNASPGLLGRKFGKRIFNDEPAASVSTRLLNRIVSTARKLAELLAEAASVPSDLAADVEEQLGRLIAFGEARTKDSGGKAGSAVRAGPAPPSSPTVPPQAKARRVRTKRKQSTRKRKTSRTQKTAKKRKTNRTKTNKTQKSSRRRKK